MKTFFQKIPLLSSAVFFLLCLFAFVFLYREINANNQNTGKEKTAWQTESERRYSMRTLDETLQKIAGERANLDTHFAKSSDVVPFLDTVEKLAPAAGAQAEVTSVDTSVDGTSLIVGLKASGNFASIYKFLTLLENSPYELEFLGVDTHKVDPADKKNSNWEALIRIQLLSFIPHI